MRYLLDTTLLIDHAKGRAGAVALVKRLFSEPNDLLRVRRGRRRGDVQVARITK